MHWFLLRHRHDSSNSSRTAEEPMLPQSTPHEPPTPDFASSSSQVPGARWRIIPSIAALLDSDVQEQEFRGLKPGPRKKPPGGDTRHPGKEPVQASIFPGRPDPIGQETDFAAKASTPQNEGHRKSSDDLKPNLLGRISKMALLPGDWTTFGRSEPNERPGLGDFRQSPSPNLSVRRSSVGRSTPVSFKRSMSSRRNPGSSRSDSQDIARDYGFHQQHPSLSQSPSTDSYYSRMKSVTPLQDNTITSRWDSTTDQRRTSRQGTMRDQHRTIALPPNSLSREHLESPLGTFGVPSPAETYVSGFDFGSETPHPLDIPRPESEVNARAVSRAITSGDGLSSNAASSRFVIPRSVVAAEHKTPHAQESSPNTTVSAARTPVKLYNIYLRARSRSSPPRMQHASNTSNSKPPSRDRSRSRSRRFSVSLRPKSSSSSNTKHSRRSSAELSARQAAAGLDWPAQVSEEMVRLALGLDSVPAVPDTMSGNSRDGRHRSSATRADNVLSSGLYSAPLSSLSCPRIPTPLDSSSLSAAGPSADDPRVSDSFFIASRSGSVSTSDYRRYLSPRTADQHHAPFTGRESGGSADKGMPRPDVGTKASNVGANRSGKGSKGGDKSRIRTSSTSKDAQPAKSSLVVPPTLSFTAATPEISPSSPTSQAQAPLSRLSKLPETPVRARSISTVSKGKRKAEALDITPPDQKKDAQRTTFVTPTGTRPVRQSGSSHAPSSYQRKRARLSSTPVGTPVHSRPGSSPSQPGQPGTAASRSNSRVSGSRAPSAAQIYRTPSHVGSTRSVNRSSERYRRGSMSGASIPISALISPHAPSIDRSSAFHMRDPRRPPKKLETGWYLRFATQDEPASAMQSWCFFIGFILFPLWWVASVWRIPKTRRVGGADPEKAVTIDDPQIEHDARSWRFRCRVMSVISVFTYIPFIVLVAVFARR